MLDRLHAYRRLSQVLATVLSLAAMFGVLWMMVLLYRHTEFGDLYGALFVAFTAVTVVTLWFWKTPAYLRPIRWRVVPVALLALVTLVERIIEYLWPTAPANLEGGLALLSLVLLLLSMVAVALLVFRPPKYPVCGQKD